MITVKSLCCHVDWPVLLLFCPVSASVPTGVCRRRTSPAWCPKTVWSVTGARGAPAQRSARTPVFLRAHGPAADSWYGFLPEEGPSVPSWRRAWPVNLKGTGCRPALRKYRGNAVFSLHYTFDHNVCVFKPWKFPGCISCYNRQNSDSVIMQYSIHIYWTLRYFLHLYVICACYMWYKHYCSKVQ